MHIPRRPLSRVRFVFYNYRTRQPSEEEYRFSYQATGEATVIEVIPIFDLSPIILRSRQAGDKINFGDFSKKLRRLFIDDKIPSEDRKNAIIAEQKGQIIFVLVAGETYLRKASKHDIMRARLYIEK